uniref:Cation-dependent mannose-6-phosphate receptor n=2 Tax=Clytia hemisphaerica TaxID=252671 RepID=A0A7M5V4P4_9CNID
VAENTTMIYIQKAFTLLALIHNFGSLTYGAKICKPVDQCSCNLEGEGEVSLHAIDQRNSPLFPDIPQSSGSTFLISYNPCTTFTKEDNCNNVLACQYASGDPTQTFPLAKPATRVFTYDETNQQVVFTYTATSSDLAKRTFNVGLKCDKTVEKPSTSGILEAPTNTYTMTLTHKCACPGVCASDAPASDSGKNLSVGSLLCILLVVFVIIYLIGGILFLKYYKKEEGSDVIPHREFWTDFPSKVKDGFKFTVSKVRKKDEYESI